MKCKTCVSKNICDEQTKLECKQDNCYMHYSPEYWIRLTEFIEEFNSHYFVQLLNDEEFFNTWELKMAKAFLLDYPEAAVRVSKIILALKDVGDIKIKIE